MKKLKLSLDELRVDSFRTTDGTDGDRRTVFAHQEQPICTKQPCTLDRPCTRWCTYLTSCYDVQDPTTGVGDGPTG